MDPDKDRPSTGRHKTQFRKGHSGNPNGRPKGTRNKATVDAKEFCNQLIDSPEYRESLRHRLLAGTAGSLEPIVWYYAKGKPVDRVESGGPNAFADVSTDELRRRLAAVVGKL